MELLDKIPLWDFIKDKIGKTFGLILGFSLANVFGSIMGFAIGALIDKLYQDGTISFKLENRSNNYLKTDFILSTLLLASSIMKSDAEQDDREILFIKKFISEQFGNDKLEEYLSILKHSKLKEPDLKKITQQIRANSAYETRLQIIYFLFGLANADAEINEKEIANIKIISIHLSIHAEDFESLKSLFINDEMQFYKMLQLSVNATDQEVKEAYRKLALKYHPDKTANNYLDNAQENFLRIKEAYDFIKNKRGFT